MQRCQKVALLRMYNTCMQQPAGFRHFTEVCEVASHVSRRFPPIHLKNRRTFTLFTKYETAKGVYQEGLQVLSSTNGLWERGQVLMYLAAATGFTFDFERMRSWYEQSQAFLEQVGDTCAVADVLKDRGAMLLLESHYKEAIDCLLGSMMLCCELGHKQYLATCLGRLSLAVGMRQEPDAETASLHSAQLTGAVASLEEAIGLTPWTRTHALVQRVGQQIRSRADPQPWQAALTAGRALTVEQAIELAHRLRAGTPC